MQGNGTITIVILGAVLLWVIYRRSQALMTRQKIRPEGLMLRLAIFAVLGAVILVLSLSDSLSLIADAVGLAVGAGVAWWALSLTTFEQQPDGLYYLPNKYIGLGVLALFVIRLIYKTATGLNAAGVLAGTNPGGVRANPFAQFAGDPVTNAVYFLLIGYYVCYYVLLILRSRQPVAAR